MRNLFLILTLSIMLTGCANRTDYGECIGVNGTKNSSLHYEYSIRNIFLAILFSETIIVPLIVIFDDLECPVESK